MSDRVSYEIHSDGRLAGLGIGIAGVICVIAGFGLLRGAPGAPFLLGACVLAIVVGALVMRRGGLVLDERGITGTGETISWRDVAGLEIAERSGKSFLLVQRIDGTVADIPVSGLEAKPEIVLERANQVRRAASAP